jgi:hypothetical protein
VNRSVTINGRVVTLDVHHNGFEWVAFEPSTYGEGAPLGRAKTAEDAISEWVEQAAA